MIKLESSAWFGFNWRETPTPFPLTLGYACDTTGMGRGERGEGKGKKPGLWEERGKREMVTKLHKKEQTRWFEKMYFFWSLTKQKPAPPLPTLLWTETLEVWPELPKLPELPAFHRWVQFLYKTSNRHWREPKPS